MVRHLHTNTKMYEGVFIFFIFNPVRWCHYHMLKQPFNKFSYCKQILKTIFSHNHNHHVIQNRTGQVFATPNFKKYKADTLPKLVFSLFLSSLIYPHPHPPPPPGFFIDKSFEAWNCNTCSYMLHKWSVQRSDFLRKGTPSAL